MKGLDLAKWIIVDSISSKSNLEINRIMWFLELTWRVTYGVRLVDEGFIIKDRLGFICNPVYSYYIAWGADGINKSTMRFGFGEKLECRWHNNQISFLDRLIFGYSKLEYHKFVGWMWRDGGLLKRRYDVGNFYSLSSEEIDREARELLSLGVISNG